MFEVASEVVTARRCKLHVDAEAKPAGKVRRLARGETLFHAGDARGQLYKVERGALCHYVRWDDGRHEVIEFAFPGDIIGFGHLETHTTTAQAVAKTIVSPVDAQTFEDLLDTDGQLAARYAAAGDREFEFVRTRAMTAGSTGPARRVASFLAALSRVTGAEGRDPHLLTDDITSGAVADQLRISIDTLTDVLEELQARGMVKPSSGGLQIPDVDALEKFADAA